MTNSIAATLITPTGNGKGISNGASLGAEGSDLSSPNATFVDFIMAHLGSMNISQDELTTITQDLADGNISKDSPLFGILGKIGDHLNIPQNGDGLSAGNELFLKELASLFIDLDASGDIKLSDNVISQLEKISAGDLPTSEMVSLIQDSDLFTELRQAIADERAHGLAKTAKKPEDIHDIATKKVKEILTDKGDEDVAGIEVVLKRLENLLSKIQTRIAQSKNPKSEEALQQLADKIAGLITRFENKMKAQTSPEGTDFAFNGQISEKITSERPIEVSAKESRYALLKAAKGQKTNEATPSLSREQYSGVSLNSGVASNTKGKTSGQGFSLSASAGNNTWLNPVEGDANFDPKIDVKAMAADHLNNSIKATKAASTQSVTRTLLPPSPAAQQVMVHIQKNAHNQSRMTIQLNPAELGRVEVSLTLAKDGRTTAAVMADRPETLQLLQKDSAHLERALQNAGLDLNAQDLSFNLRGDGNNNFKSGRRFGRHTGNNNTLSVDNTQLTGAQLDAAVFSQYRVNYKA